LPASAYLCARLSIIQIQYSMIVLKFGGTSVGTPDTIKGLIQILKSYQARGERFTVVYSAFSKVTDTLIDMANRAAQGDESYQQVFDQVKSRHEAAVEALLEPANRPAVLEQINVNFSELSNVLQGVFLLQELSPRSLDLVVSFGERNSAFIIAHAMTQAGIPSEFLDARTVVRTDAQFGNAKVDFEETNRLIAAHYATTDKTQAVTGFVASTGANLTTVLGRGGSDYTAAIFGAALHAKAIEIWTDVDGVLTADPRRVKKAFTLPTMTYGEAMEMSHFGAKVIYPPTILPALAKNIPLYIKNTFNPEFPGTYISKEAQPSDYPVKGISSIDKVALLTLQGSGLFGVPGISARLFGALAKANINIVLITQGSSETSITFAVPPDQGTAAKKAVEREFAYEIRDSLVEPIKVEQDYGVVAIIGENMRYQPGMAGRLFQALGKNGVNIVAIAQGSSELNISTVIATVDITKALNAIHEAFFLSDTHTVNLFVTGVGLIGSTLLRQMQEHADFLRKKRRMELKVVGLANSRKMVFSEAGVGLGDWKNAIEQGEPFTIARFVEKMTKMNLPNAIFIDNTGSEEVASQYAKILDESISISTPNKVAASSTYTNYLNLKHIAEKRGVLWRYEANVGAGLPIISTLNDLITAGDSILKIEGILSGTLSYIFNHFCAPSPAPVAPRFSYIVKEAKAKGLTEPDPRDDLSGSDIRRKLLILAREAGLPMEMSDIQIEGILPESCVAAKSVDDFFTELEKHDGYFEQLRGEAARNGQVLRFVAKLEDNRATISLQRFDTSHPFYFLSGSDNMVVFTTERYRERPLVVRGPGAGAEVTAAGVFAEIVAIGNYLG
jgi:bifunctional aspartokinase / homoserine dehydrogenase 1